MPSRIVTISELYDFCTKYFTDVSICKQQRSFTLYVDIKLNFVEALFLKFYKKIFEAELYEEKVPVLNLEINYHYNIFGKQLIDTESKIK